MSRRAGYEESWNLTYLVEQLRELIGRDLSLDEPLAEELEDILGSLVLRNQRLRGLQRMVQAERSLEDLMTLRDALEAMDHELMERLPSLLDRLRAAHS